MEEKVSVVIKKFGVKLMNQGRGILDVARLDRVSDLDPVVHRLEINLRGEAALLLEFLRGLLEALWSQRWDILSNKQVKDCGTVDRALVSDARDLWFESHHREISVNHIYHVKEAIQSRMVH